jgi:hypothetical protein
MSQANFCLDQAIDAAKDKLGEARYFLGHMEKIEKWSFENLADAERYFGYESNAFLSAARSVLQVLSAGIGFWAPIDAVRSTWNADEQKLERTLTNSRNLNVHYGKEVAESCIESVPHSELPSRPPDPFAGYVFIARLPGTPEPRRGVRRFAIEIDGQDRPAVECCRDYLGLMEHIVAVIEGNNRAAGP